MIEFRQVPVGFKFIFPKIDNRPDDGVMTKISAITYCSSNGHEYGIVNMTSMCEMIDDRTEGCECHFCKKQELIQELNLVGDCDRQCTKEEDYSCERYKNGNCSEEFEFNEDGIQECDCEECGNYATGDVPCCTDKCGCESEEPEDEPECESDCDCGMSSEYNWQVINARIRLHERICIETAGLTDSCRDKIALIDAYMANFDKHFKQGE